MVEDYITRNIGPKAVIADLWKTARVLARFGPRLPDLAEAALIAQLNAKPQAPKSRWKERLTYGAIGFGIAGGMVAVAQFF